MIELDEGSTVRTDVVVLGAGWRPRLDGLGLDTVGVQAGAHGVAVDERCRVTDGVWAVGDVTGVSLFTHLAQYQGRVVVDNILGHDRTTNYTAIPRVVFAGPEIAAVGLTTAGAHERGQCQVLIGAWAVSPLAGEWIHQAALAIRAHIPLEVRRDGIAQFPTYSEVYLKALETLQPQQSEEKCPLWINGIRWRRAPRASTGTPLLAPCRRSRPQASSHSRAWSG